MRKLKLLFTACALLTFGGGSLWAQTDVTSTYLTNPSFELSAAGTTTSAQALTNGGTYYGWTLPSLGENYVNISIGDASNCNGQAFGIPTASEGSYYYYCRRGWNSSSSADATLSTTLANMSVGHYTLTMAYKGLDSWDSGHNSKGSYLKVEAVEETTLASQQTATFDAVNGNNAGSGKFTGASNWKSVTLEFDVATASDVTLNIVHHFVGGVRTDAVIDNLQLAYTDPEAAAHAAALEAAKNTLNGYIKKATALNGILADETLATAIETAQGVYDAADDYAEDYENTVNASTTLNTAITTALGGATAVSLTNGNFDTTPNLLADGTEGNNDVFYYNSNNASEAYNYNVTGWTNASVVSGNATFGGTGEYGSTATICGTTPPAADMFGASEGAALALADGWGSTSRYQQVKEALSAGRYLLYFEAYNQNTATGIGSNYFGASGTAGDFYGTTNSFVYDENKTFASGEWKATAIEFDVAKAADITIGVGMGGSGSSGANAKLWIDNVLVYRIGDVIVSETDASTIISSVEALDEAVYNATDKSALASAKETFVANKTLDNYNALNAALVTAQNSVTVYTALDAAITKVEGWTSNVNTVTTPMRTKYTNGTYSDETTAADIYSEYQAAELAALATAEATDYTSAILNASFETGDMTGWSAEIRNDTGVKQQSNGTYSINSGDAVDGSYLFNSWGGTAENNVYQTIKNLPAGTYTLSALVAGFNGESLVLAANSKTATVTVAGDKTVGYTANVVFTLDVVADVIIKACNTKSQESSDASFIKADNFRLFKGDVTTNDYTALNAALNAVKDYVIGFEEGQYNPYTNKEAVAALDAAKAVNQTQSILVSDLETIVNNLTSATWTVNTENTNMVYNGNFALSTANTTSGSDLDIPGWTPNGSIRQVIENGVNGTFPALAETTGNKAMFTWSGTIVYGAQSGYSLPLAAHTIYELTFKHAGWNGSNNNFYVKITSDDDDVLSLQTCGQSSAGPQTAGCWNTYRILFATVDACNAYLNMIPSGNSSFTDIVLKKATKQYLEFADNADMPKYAPGTYPTVKITRTLTANRWATAVYPFAVSGVNNIAVLNSYDAENGVLRFTSADASTANEPFLMRSTAGTENIILSNVEVAATASAPVVTKSEASLKGAYTTTSITNDDKNYVLSNNKIYSVGTAGATINPYRAYIQVAQAGDARTLRLVFDGNNGETTGISATLAEDGQMADGIVYNLNGQRIGNAQSIMHNSQLKPGLYIVNGKKVVVK